MRSGRRISRAPLIGASSGIESLWAWAGPSRSPRRRTDVGGTARSPWETPGGLTRELARVDGEFSALQQEMKDVLFARGYPDRVDAQLRPLVDLYLHSWIPLILRWQKFYADQRGWSGNYWQWTHQPELDDLTARLSQVSTLARGLMGPPTAVSPTPNSPSAPTPSVPPIDTIPIPFLPIALPFTPPGIPVPASPTSPWRPSYNSIELLPAIGLGAIGVVALALLIDGARGRS